MLFISLTDELDGLSKGESHLWELDLSVWFPVEFDSYPLKGY